MFKPQMKFQKIMSIALLILAALTFFYSIGIATDIYPLHLAEALESVDGYQFFTEIQPYNKQEVIFSIVVVVASLTPFIFASNTRRKYYWDNYLGFGIQGGVFIAYSIFTIIETTIYKNRFLTEVDVEGYKAWCEKKGHFYSGTTIWFDLGYVFAALCLIAVGIIVFNIIWKIKLEKAEKALLAGGSNDGK